MTNVIAFANNKGGSGKTTTCSNVGCALALEGRRVLLIDGDMQCNLTISYFDEERALGFMKEGKTIHAAIANGGDLSSYIVKTKYENLDLVPSSSLMSGIELELFSKKKRELVLSGLIRSVRESGAYDYILIDAPPTLGMWVTNVLAASDHVILPVEASPWGLFGLANMFEFCGSVRKISPHTEILGIVITKADERKKYFKQTLETLRALDGVRLFETYIHVDSAVEWSQDCSEPVVAFRRSGRSAREYQNLSKEIETYANR